MAPNASRFSTFLAYVAESTPGTTPGSPSMLKLRTTDPLALTAEKESFQSEESFAHRQRENIRHGRENVSGNIPIELSYGAFDDWLEALLGGSWSTETAGTPEILKVGNNKQTFSVERGFPDISQYQVFKGVTPVSLSLDIGPSGIVTGQFGVIGMGFDALAGSSLGAAADVATNEPFDGLGNATLQEGGSGIAIVTGLSLNMSNNRATGGLVGSAESDAPENGLQEITGELTARFQDAALVDKFKNETESSLQVVLNDTGGAESLTIDLHRIKYSGSGQGENENVVDVTLPFEALYDDGEATAITITRSNAA